MKQADPRWSSQQIELASRVQRSDVARALALIEEASPELADMVQAEATPAKKERSEAKTI